MALLISKRSTAWKRVSLEVASRPLYRTELPIFERYAAGKRHSWASQNQNLFVLAMTISQCSQPEYAILENQKIDPLQFCTAHIWTFRSLKTHFLNISKSTLLQDIRQLSERFETENVIPDNQQIDIIAVLHRPYLNVLQLENRIREYQQNDHLAQQH